MSKKKYDSKLLVDGPIEIHPHTYYQGHGVDIVNQLNEVFNNIGTTSEGVEYKDAYTTERIKSMVNSLSDGQKFLVTLSDGTTIEGTGAKASEYYNIDCGDTGHIMVMYDGSDTISEGNFSSEVVSVSIGSTTSTYSLKSDDSKVDKVNGTATNLEVTADANEKALTISDGEHEGLTFGAYYSSGMARNVVYYKFGNGKAIFPHIGAQKTVTLALNTDVDKKVDKENGEASNLTLKGNVGDNLLTFSDSSAKETISIKLSNYANDERDNNSLAFGITQATGAYIALPNKYADDTFALLSDLSGYLTGIPNPIVYDTNIYEANWFGTDNGVFYFEYRNSEAYGSYKITVPKKANGTLALTSDIPTTDTSLDSSSSNPIANSAVKTALDGKVDASSGTATNLTVTNQLTVKNTDGSSSMVITPSTDGSASATSGGGTLLFPYIGSGTTETVATLSDLPTKTSDLTNDSNYMVLSSGTFDNKPASPVVGQMYFCTDKQTTEGATNGIAIFYNGTAWVDALGRTIS